MPKGGLFDKAKDMLGGAAADLKGEAEKLAEGAAVKIDEATEAGGGVVKKVGDVIGESKDKVGDAAAGLMDRLGKGRGSE